MMDTDVPTEVQLVEAFKQYDQDKTGTITSETLATILRKLEVDDETINVGIANAGWCSDEGNIRYRDFVAWVMGGMESIANTPLLQVCRTGVSQVYLAKLRTEVPHINRLPDTEQIQPRYETLDGFRTQYSLDEAVQERLRNKVKVCKCGKACAYTLANCNQCGASLQAVSISYNDNVFMGFIYGIGRGCFPYKISIRHQGQDFLCFDDPLSVTVCHLNAIPTNHYIPDLRYLFLDPSKGLALINKLFEVAATAALESFWGNAIFREKFFNNEKPPETPEGLFDIALCGMNFPPSMYQLHLQFIHPPLLPFHYSLARNEGHFHYGRFFPLEYLRKMLALGDAIKMKVSEQTDINELIAKGKELGINYDEIQIGLMRRCRCIQERFSPWRTQDFAYQVVDSQVICSDTFTRVLDADPKVIQEQDSRALANYGRPFDKDGKPFLSYYKYAKDPKEVTSWP